MQKLISEVKTTLPPQLVETFGDIHVNQTKDKAFIQAMNKLIGLGRYEIVVDKTLVNGMYEVTVKVVDNG